MDDGSSFRPKSKSLGSRLHSPRQATEIDSCTSSETFISDTLSLRLGARSSHALWQPHLVPRTAMAVWSVRGCSVPAVKPSFLCFSLNSEAAKCYPLPDKVARSTAIQCGPKPSSLRPISSVTMHRLTDRHEYRSHSVLYKRRRLLQILLL